jgi:NADPH2:quinone reductase
MHAIRVNQVGGPEALSYEDIPQPEPGPGEIRLKVEAAGINFIDIYYRTGQYKTSLPVTPGSEGAGIIDAVGPDVTEFQPGDRAAFAMSLGSYAEYVTVPVNKVVLVPASVETRLAAAVLLQGMTAHYLAVDTYPIREGDTALIHAAAGGLGNLLVQVAKLRGARVIGTVSTAEKAQRAREAGADDMILYTETDFEEEVKRLTEGKGVDVVYDSVGLTTFDKGLNCLRRRGMMVLCGQSSGAVPPFDPQTLNARGSLFLTRPTLGHYVAERSELLQRTADLFDWMAAGKLKVRVDREFPLEDAAEAHRYLESRQSKGKLLLIP